VVLWSVYPAFDRIPAEYLDNVVELLDPSKIKFTTAITYITTEKFWARLCLEKWAVRDLSQHGNSCKRMYAERHLWHMIGQSPALTVVFALNTDRIVLTPALRFLLRRELCAVHPAAPSAGHRCSAGGRRDD
jgi:hypothetical protein